MKKRSWFIYILFLLSCANTMTAVKAQQIHSISNDSLSVKELIQLIESKTSFKVFGDIDPSFMLRFEARGVPSVEALRKAFDKTPYRISAFENKLFILKSKELYLYSSLSLMPEGQHLSADSLSFTQLDQTEKANSENLIYSVGNPYLKELPKTITLRGKVTDSKTGAPLPGVNLILKEPYSIAATDKTGRFSIKLPVGRHELSISGLNVKESRRQLMLYGDGNLDIELVEEIYQLNEVVITSGKTDNVRNVQLGVEKLQVSKIKNIPSVLGETDILRAIQTLPGVKTVGEASTGFNVRGGATDQNLILLDEGTIYNPNHLFGFFTAFSSEMVKEAELYKSSIPAQYGGRISSVLDITGKEASKEKFCGSASIGLVTSNLSLEIPLVKNKTSILLNGRTTYSDWILGMLPKESGYKDGKAGFYDLGTTISHTFDPKNSLNLYGYYSHDHFSFNPNQQYGYSNANTSAKWKRIFNEKLLGILAGGYDHYDYTNTESTDPYSAYKLSFAINQLFAKMDFTLDLHKHKLDFGWKSILYNIHSGTYIPVGEKSLVRADQLQEERALESALYLGDQWDITPKFSVNAGIRYSIFNALGPRTYYAYEPNLLPYENTITDTLQAGKNKIIKTYQGPEYRLSARYMLKDNLSVKAGFNSMRQYIHKVSNTIIMSPTDIWKLSDAHVLPQQGWQVSAGIYHNSPQKDWETSCEVYYKEMKDYLDYRGGARLIMNHHLETDVINTEGYAYGVELSLKKNIGKLNGWASYSYSRTFLRQNDPRLTNPINKGNWYPADYDKPHDFKMVGNYKITQRYSFSLNVDYSTGRPITIPAGRYVSQTQNTMQVYFIDRNSYRIPDYFRMDASFNIEPSHKLTVLTHSSISFGVYNLTGRNNVYSIYYSPARGGSIQGYQLSILGSAIPYVSYNIKF